MKQENRKKPQNIIGNIKWWQIGLLSVAISLLGRLAGGTETDEQKVYTRELKQAPWAPPAWLFGPAWTLNNFFLLLGLKRLYTEDLPDKKKLLILQALIWTIFFSFNYVYFRKRSTVLAAVWTVSDAVLATASLIVANKVDKKVSMSYLPLTAWTMFASTLAGYQALKNPDKALGTSALPN